MKSPHPTVAQKRRVFRALHHRSRANRIRGLVASFRSRPCYCEALDPNGNFIADEADGCRAAKFLAANVSLQRKPGGATLGDDIIPDPIHCCRENDRMRLTEYRQVAGDVQGIRTGQLHICRLECQRWIRRGIEPMFTLHKTIAFGIGAPDAVGGDPGNNV